MERLQTEFHFTGSNKARKTLARTQLVSLFAPLASFFRAKAAQIQLSGEILGELSECMSKTGELFNKIAAAGPSGVERYQDELDKHLAEASALEQRVHQASERLGFASKGEAAKSYQAASEFQDSWVEGPMGRFRSWYACSCGCIMSSKSWRRKHEQHDAPRQKYYCVACGRKYKVSFGQVIEVCYPGHNMTAWAKASIPPDHLEDVRAMHSESKGVAAATPQEWFRALEQFVPSYGSVFRKMAIGELYDPSAPGASELLNQVAMLTPEGKALLESRPMFPWEQLMTLF